MFERGRFHAETGSLWGAPGGRALPICFCEIRQQIAETLTPKDSMTAPSATCAVATSAALLLQMIQAPSAIWQATKANHNIDSRFSAVRWRASLQIRRQNAMIAIAMTRATKRCAICNQIWNAVTSDNPRASRHTLIFASAGILVSGIQAPFAVGKSRIARS